MDEIDWLFRPAVLIVALVLFAIQAPDVARSDGAAGLTGLALGALAVSGVLVWAGERALGG
jgi:hypothetical protein